MLHHFLRVQKADALNNLGIFSKLILYSFFLKFVTRSTKQHALTYGRRCAMNVHEYRTDQVPYAFVFKVCSHWSSALIGLMINVSNSH